MNYTRRIRTINRGGGALCLIFFCVALFLMLPLRSEAATSVAYITASGPDEAFVAALANNGYTVTNIPLASSLNFDNPSYASFDLIIIGSDTFSTTTSGAWGGPTGSAVSIASSGVPILGLGEGGLAFFNDLALKIGFNPAGYSSGNTTGQLQIADPSSPIFSSWPGTTTQLIIGSGNNITTWEVCGSGCQDPSGLELLGLDPTSHACQTCSYYPLIQQNTQLGSYFLWGFDGDFNNFSTDGQTLLLNVVGYMAGLAPTKTFYDDFNSDSGGQPPSASNATGNLQSSTGCSVLNPYNPSPQLQLVDQNSGTQIGVYFSAHPIIDTTSGILRLDWDEVAEDNLGGGFVAYADTYAVIWSLQYNSDYTLSYESKGSGGNYNLTVPTSVGGSTPFHYIPWTSNHFTVLMDFAAQTFDLYIDYIQVLAKVPFVDPTGSGGNTELDFGFNDVNSSTHLLDNVVISPVQAQITYMYYKDQDGDGFGDPSHPITSPSPTPPPGYATNSLDCNDTDATVHPGAANVCGQDKSCSGSPYQGTECSQISGASLQAPSTAVAPGQPIWVTASFANPSSEPIQIIRPDCRDTVFTLLDSNGRVPAPVERIGTSYDIPGDVVTIPAGGGFTVRCNVADMYRPEALTPGSYTVQAVYSNSWKDPDLDTTTDPPTCSNQPCYTLWNGAVSAASSPATVTVSSAPAVKVLPGVLSFDQSTWYLGCSAVPTITATLSIPNLAAGSTISAVTLNGVDAQAFSFDSTTGILTAKFDGMAAINSLGTVISGQIVYPECEAILSSKDVVRASAEVRLSAYKFSGFFAPVADAGTGATNTIKAGQAVPIKWLLTDCNGNGVSDFSAFPLHWESVSCKDDSVTNEITTDTSAGSSGLQYLGSGYWQYNWKTSKSNQGCQAVYIKLDDETAPASANFQFKK